MPGISHAAATGGTTARLPRRGARTLLCATALVLPAVFGVGAPIATGEPGGGLSPDQQRLMNFVSKGFMASSCQSAAHPARGSIASLDCFNNSEPGGPKAATYDLFADQGTMDSAFSYDVSISNVEPCPGGDPSPGSWAYGSQVQGQKVCDTYNGTNEVAWTNNSTLVYADTQSSDLPSLYQWWKQYG
jgi:hypothetical protein